jgi:hypothetical protein
MRFRLIVGFALLEATAGSCRRPGEPGRPAVPVRTDDDAPPVPGGMRGDRPKNRFAYIPPQCYTATQDREGGAVHNPCYACHQHPVAPNFVDDSDLQLSFRLPSGAAHNPWRNLFAPPIARTTRESDRQILARVHESNYFDAAGDIPLARRLRALPAAWDGENDQRWNGYIPDARFNFDERGFDRNRDGSATGWRAFTYTPFPGGFMPTNGSMDDVLIRLDPAMQQDARGHWDQQIYEINLAVVEALIRRADVAINPVFEDTFGVDIDLDGVIGRATKVAFRPPTPGQTAMHYVGRARELENDGTLQLVPGLFPLNTEFLHSVRYLDVDASGAVVMAPRMKELRYAKKVRWLSSADLAAHAAAEATEQNESPDGAVEFIWQFDRGIYNGQGWLLQGFIEAANGVLRPQSYEESLYCVGCHGEIGATTDSIFAFARKLGDEATARGWFHITQRDRGLHGLPEPRRRDGQFEYSYYLINNDGADDLRENTEARARFFDAAGARRADAFERLHQDVGALLVPSADRALDLDRAYGAIVRAQSFTDGRDAVLASSRHVQERVTIGKKTGVERALLGPSEEESPKPVLGHRLGG